jgi:exosome complex component MTR3
MPPDRMRIAGPSETQSPASFYKGNSKNNLVAEGGKRLDGRTASELRPIFLKSGVITQAKGSSYIELDKTKVICAVYGPREVPSRQEFSIKGLLYCDMKYAPFSCHTRRQHIQDREEKDLSVVLQHALEPVICLYKFPKAQVDVFVTVLENDGGALSAAITAAGVALADAGVPMYDMVVACSLRQYGSVTLIDPTEAEEYKARDYSHHVTEGDEPNQGNVTLSLMPGMQQVSAFQQDGPMSVECVSSATKDLMTVCQQVYPVVRKCLEKGVRRTLRQLKRNEAETSADRS